MNILQRMLISIFVASIAAGCATNNTSPPKTLSLTLANERGRLQVTDYSVLDNPFKESRQQGLYQAHLIDAKGTILQRVSFDKLEVPVSASQHKQQDAGHEFYVALPLSPKLRRIKIYKLDGSSGHYKLKADEPLLDWELPELANMNDEQ